MAYAYRILAVNSSGFEAASLPFNIRLQNLPPVQLFPAAFDSRTAAAALSWTQYEGRDFSLYRVIRSSGPESQLITQIEDRSDTSYIDTGLVGNREYSYHVDVVTERGEITPSLVESGILHPLVGSWPLDVEDEGYVRLYMEDGNLLALVSDLHRVRLIFFDATGGILEEQILIHDRDPDCELGIHPGVFALASQPNGNLYLGLALGTTAVLLAFDSQGTQIRSEYTFTVNLAERGIDPALPLESVSLFSRPAYFDNLTVVSNGREFSDDFSEDRDFTPPRRHRPRLTDRRR